MEHRAKEIETHRMLSYKVSAFRSKVSQVWKKDFFTSANSRFFPPSTKCRGKLYLGLLRRLATSLAKVGHLGLAHGLLELLGGVEGEVDNAGEHLVDAAVERLAVPLVDERVEQQQLGDVVVGDAGGQAVARLGHAQAGLVGGEAEVRDAALKGGAGGGLAGGQVRGDFVLGEEARDG
ncbi:hypothetical protein MKX07_003195 [Trichoderma sp. CBMAI-0711]|nr:hypothetical protein MKX07_003195 [Trichoderma sp. CBMAI-0711]